MNVLVELIPETSFHILESDTKLPAFPKFELTELVGFADAAYHNWSENVMFSHWLIYLVEQPLNKETN